MVYTIKVRGFHLDLYGHVNNARYLEFLEAARWELLDQQVDLDDWHRRGLSLTVVRIAIDYRRSATLGTMLEVRTRLVTLESRSGTFRQTIYFAGTEEKAAEADVTFVLVDQSSGRATRIEDDIRESLAALS